MTYTVSSGTLNSTIPYHTATFDFLSTLHSNYLYRFRDRWFQSKFATVSHLWCT